MASPAFWSVYLSPLLKELRTKGIGCHIAGMFMGVVAYADDLVLVAPNRTAAQNMLGTCEQFATENNIQFSTDVNPNKSKSKALYVVGQKGQCEKPVPLMLCGKALPWVDKCDHLGHSLNVWGSLEQDCRIKRAKFIEDSVKIREQFKFAHPTEIIAATETYCSSYYGHNLWGLRGEAANMLYSSWRTSVKLAWNLPRGTRSYFIDNLLAPGVTPPSVSLMTRQLSFFHSLLSSPSPEAETLARLSSRDIRSTLGSNLAHIKTETGLNPWEFGGDRIKMELIAHNASRVSENDQWRIGFLDKLLNQRLHEYYNGSQECKEIDAMINSLSTS